MSLSVEIIVQDHYFSPDDSQSLREASPQENPLGNQAVPITIATWEAWLQQWLEVMQQELPQAIGYELSLRLTNDRDIRQLNAQYRQKDQATDVLAFAALEVDYPRISEEPLYLGDIIISVETAQGQAQERDHTLLVELAWLAAHGFLHLLGWDHPDDNSLAAMLQQQEVLLASVGLVV
jgi:probable rRNA maturation factor